ncbi:cysteine desulfurase family protein [Occallatibacter riparius]|uniref:cysteine desulfurase n=1 Tax=Occallatibacter riparius TaxID=1002689 RepID=A0A9J7BVR5_9BACT|nr:aminotransferase class V-fold PLP-dependent enzyme [Occallatibacter riparius]UWZ86963.1 aminotransferase class V-fold PLP-dependent enzyme [Occallatibacter riparius]
MVASPADPRLTRVYMDANATTPLLPEVVQAMHPYWMEHFGNASSIHLHGQQARRGVDQAREILAEFFNCHAAEVVFNSGGTEGDNSAIFGLLRRGDHFVTTAIEHSAVLQSAEKVAERGVEVSYIAPQPSGLIEPGDVRAALRPNTRLISVMLANNETGVIQPVEEIGRIAKDAGAFFHVDGVQAAGKIPIDVRKIGCHLLSISGHKMHAPKGVGAMFVRRGTPVESLLVGGSHERRRRAGTENVAGIVGLGKAAELAMSALEDGTIERVARLRDRLEDEILRLPGAGVNGAGADGRPVARVANTTNIWFNNLEGEALVIALDLKGVAVSGGSACHSGATEPSHVLMAMGLDKTRARASLRFSLLKTTTDADVDHVLSVVPAAVKQLRAVSPVEAGTLG